MTNRIPVTVPDLGDFNDVEVIDVLVKVGDSVQADTSLITLETEKATMDVPAPIAGVVTALAVAKGDRISTGSLVLLLEVAGSSSPPEPAVTAPPEAPAATAPAMHEPVSTAPPQAATHGVAGQASVDVHVPDLGDFKDVAIIDIPVHVGDHVEVDSTLLTLESEKAAMDVPSPVAGRIVALHVSAGGRVASGTLVATIEAASAPRVSSTAEPATPAMPPAAPPAAIDRSAPVTAAAPVNSAAAQMPAPASVAAPANPVAESVGFARAYAGPSVRRLARELGVDLGRVNGTGLKSRITHEDVKAYVKKLLSQGPAVAATAVGAALPRVPTVDFTKFGPVETVPLGRIQRISGQRLHASWVNLPHVTQFDVADITLLEETRNRLKSSAQSRGVKLTPLAFVLRALAKSLAAFPRFCASLDASGENLVVKKYMHIGFAADTPQGLMVPVIRDVDRKDVYEIAADLASLSEKARDGKLSGAEMTGGCFTVSSLGGIGGTYFTPIINAPEVAILGLSRSAMQPVWKDNAFVPRLMLPLSLSYDHRVIDGADGARFTTHLAQMLQDVPGLLEAVP